MRVALFVLVMVAVIVAVDVAFFRGRPAPRLLANVGIVLVFAGAWLTWLRRP